MEIESISGATVFVIDDDACLRAALKKLFEVCGPTRRTFPVGGRISRKSHSKYGGLHRARCEVARNERP